MTTIRTIMTSLLLLASTFMYAQLAGPDLSTCVNVPVNMQAAQIQGTWSDLPTNPSWTNIDDPSAYNTLISGFGMPGVYGFIWISGVDADTAYVYVFQGNSQTILQSGNICSGIDTLSIPGTAGSQITWFRNGTQISIGDYLAIGATPGTYTASVYSAFMTCNDTAVLDILPCTSSAGPDRTVCASTTIYMQATGTGSWSELSSNPSAAYIGNSTSPTTSIQYLDIAGTYGFVWSDGSTFDTVYIHTLAKPDAGQDFYYICSSDSIVTNATASSGAVWRYRSGPGTVSIADSTSPTTHIRFPGGTVGSYFFAWTNSNGCFDSTVVALHSCVVNTAGPDRLVSCVTLPGGSATMAGSGAGTWTAVSGNPGTATIGTPTSPTTAITTFSAAGTYYFIWTYTGGADTALVTVTAKPNAGPNKTATVGGSATMAAVGTGTWTARTGNPGTSAITTSSSPTTTITAFSGAGTYYYIWTSGTCTDTAVVIVSGGCTLTGHINEFLHGTYGQLVASVSGGSGAYDYNWIFFNRNIPGYVINITNDGPYEVVVRDTSTGCQITLHDTVTGLVCNLHDTIRATALGAGQYHFTCTYSGTNHPSFYWLLYETDQIGPGATTSFDTTFAPGTYMVSVHVYDTTTSCSNGDSIVIVVPATSFSAGPDRSVSCAVLPGGTATMAGSGTGTWTARSGNPGTATIATPTSPTTAITTFSAAGTYYFIWTYSGGTDTAIVTVTAQPNAGPDRVVSCVTFPGGSATMGATGTGIWSASSGNPATATIAAPSSPTTAIINYAAPGVYTFFWSNGTCRDTAIVTITGRPNAGPDKVATVGGSATMSAVGTGTWTARTGNPGTSAITTSSSPTTTITGFSTTGIYYYIWASGACTDTAAVVVSSSSPCGMIITDSIHRPSCSGASNGEVFIYVSGGTPPYQYKVGANGTLQSSNRFTGLSSTTNKYYVKDATGCTDSITITPVPGVVAVPSISYIPLGNRTYRFTANDVGYYHPKYWWWSDYTNLITTSGSKSITYTFPTTGSHSMEVTVYDSTVVSCPVDDSLRFVIPASCSLYDSLSYTALGGTQYSFSAHTTGSTRPGYFWTVPATWIRQSGTGGTAVYSVPSSGVYSVTLTTVDSTTGCGFTQTINVNLSPSCSLVMYDTVTDPSCILNSGYVRLTAAAGTAPYQYRIGVNGPWQSSAIFSSLFAGIDTFYTMDAGGCVVSVIDTLVRSTNLYPSVAPTSNSPVALGGTITLFRNGSGAGAFPTTAWTGPNSFTSTTVNPTISGATAAATGIYAVKYGDVFCKVSDSILVMVGSGGAGLDQLVSCVTLPGGVATMLAYGSGSWTTIAGNPGTATITNPSSPTTTITNFTAAGIYNFLYTTSGAQIDTVRVTVTTMPSAGPDRSLSCVPLSGGSVTMAATGTGTWRARTGNPGTSHITTTTSATTTITAFSAPGSYYYIWTNAGGCTDTAMVTVTSIPDAPVLYATGGCPGTDTLTINVVPIANQITWLLNGGIVHTATPTDTTFVPTVPGSYTATVTAGLCQSSASNATTLLSCLSDSVWPGDANHDGLADHTDLLPIGIAYGLNGFPRPDQSIVWSAHYAQDWGVQFINGTNTKHADCDGNAVINADDTLAILQNFGLTHAKTGGYPDPWRTGIPGLTVKYSKDTVVAGDTLVTSLLLGDSAHPVSNIYGLAFTYHYDPIVLDSTSISFDFINSFIGNGTNRIYIHKDYRTDGTIKAAITGINHLSRNGQGEIAQFICIITTDNINGKDLSYFNNLSYISDITAQDNDGNAIPLNAGIDSNSVAYEPTGIREAQTGAVVSIYPNPAANQVTVTTQSYIDRITIIDILGQEVQTISVGNKRSEIIDVSRLPLGVYTIRVSAQTGSGTAKLIIRR